MPGYPTTRDLECRTHQDFSSSVVKMFLVKALQRNAYKDGRFVVYPKNKWIGFHLYSLISFTDKLKVYVSGILQCWEHGLTGSRSSKARVVQQSIWTLMAHMLDVCISLVHNKISHKSKKSFSVEEGFLSRVGLRNHALPFQPSNYTDRIDLL